MTNFFQMLLRAFKIAAIIAIPCICVDPAMGQRGGRGGSDIFGTGGSPAAEAQTPISKQQIRIFQLKYNDAETITRVLNNLLTGNDGTRIVPDRRINALIVAGAEEQIKTIGAIVEKLDIPGQTEQKHPLPINVRVIWLVDGEENAAAPADNLKEVVEELHRQGFKHVGQLAQTMVRSQNDGQFQISSSPLLGNNTVTLSARGTIHSESKLEVSISASEERTRGIVGQGGGGIGGGSMGPGGMNTLNLVNVNVTTVCIMNEYIVLAVAPIGKITSAFVIQITEGKP